MKKKIIGMFVSLLLMTMTVPVIGSVHKSLIPLNAPYSNARPCTLGWSEIQKLLPSDGSDSEFGFTISLNNDTAIIGAPYDMDLGLWTGAAYIFIKNDTAWTQQAKLLAADGGDFNFFGCAVALDGDTAFIAATNTDEDNVSVYVFLRSGSTWSQQQKLPVANITEGYWMDISISLVDDTALMGVPSDSLHGANSGSATVFTRTGTTWTRQQKLFPADIIEYDNFGGSVSLSEDIALIGAVGDDESGSVSGSVYEFIRSGTTWVEHQKLLASDGTAGDHFGFALALDDDTVLIGAPGDSDQGNGSGSAYVFIHSGDTWTEQQKLLASDGDSYDTFGISVALQGNTALVGAEFDHENGDNAGAAYVFLRSGTTWSQNQKLLASDGTPHDMFGCAISIDRYTLMIGALGDGGGSAGSVYVFIRGNQPPEPPTITGPHYGKNNTMYSFSIGAPTDPEGDQLYCLWDWGDGNTNDWTGPYNSGVVIQQSNAWRKPGTYTMKVKLKDNNGLESNWSEPFSLQIVQLKTAFYLGTFESYNQTFDLFIIEAKTFIVFPFTPVISKGRTIVLWREYHGYLGKTIAFGIGGISIL